MYCKKMIGLKLVYDGEKILSKCHYNKSYKLLTSCVTLNCFCLFQSEIFVNCCRLRRLARLDKKNDERLTAYYIDFMAMCRRVCGKATDDDEGRGQFRCKLLCNNCIAGLHCTIAIKSSVQSTVTNCLTALVLSIFLIHDYHLQI